MKGNEFGRESGPPGRDEPKGSAKAAQEPAEDKGLRCWACGCRHFTVIYTRPAPRGRVRRRKECRFCGRRTTTYEQEMG